MYQNKKQTRTEKLGLKMAEDKGSTRQPLAPVAQARSFFSIRDTIQDNPDRPPSPNYTGIPAQMKKSYEAAAGLSLDDVRVHYRSPKPAQLRALAYTQGTQVYIGPGQERHLAHELGHVVQQKRGLVRPTGSLAGLPVNNDPILERQADTPPSQYGGMEDAAPVVQRLREDLAQILANGDLNVISQKILQLFQDGDEQRGEFLGASLAGGANTGKYRIVRNLLGMDGLGWREFKIIAICVNRSHLEDNFKYYVNCLYALNRDRFRIRIFIEIFSHFLNPFWDFAVQHHRAAVLADNGALVQAVLLDACQNQRAAQILHILTGAVSRDLGDETLFSHDVVFNQYFINWVMGLPLDMMSALCLRIFHVSPPILLEMYYPSLLALNDFEGCIPIFSVIFQDENTPSQAMDALLQQFGLPYLDDIARFSRNAFWNAILDFCLGVDQGRALRLLIDLHVSPGTLLERYYPRLLALNDFEGCIPIFSVIFQDENTPPQAMDALLQRFGLPYLDDIARFSHDVFLDTILDFCLGMDKGRALRFLIGFRGRLSLDTIEYTLLTKIGFNQTMLPMIGELFAGSIRFSPQFWAGSGRLFNMLIESKAFKLISTILCYHTDGALEILAHVMQENISWNRGKTIRIDSLCSALAKEKTDPDFINTILRLPTWEYINKLGLYVCKYDGDIRIAFVQSGSVYICVGIGSYHDRSGYHVGNKFNYVTQF